MRILIDAGHGGEVQAGKSSAYGSRGPCGTIEKDVTLDIARRVVERLGGSASLTRSGDANLPLRARAELGSHADVFVSIHANSGPPERSGPETFVHPEAGADSHRLARGIQQSLAGVHGYGGHAAPESGTMAVLDPRALGRRTAACLVEVDYLSNPYGEQRLRDPGHRAAIGAAIAGAIRAHVGSPRYGATTLLVNRRLPRSVTAHGGNLYVLDRLTGAITRYAPTGGAGTTIFAGFTRSRASWAFVGLCVVWNTLVFSEFGDTREGNSDSGEGVLHAVNLDGSGYRLVARRRGGDFLRGAAGVATVDNGTVAVSSFWGHRVDFVHVRDGEHPASPIDFSRVGALRDRNGVGPESLFRHSSGNLLICDRNNDLLLAAPAVSGGVAFRVAAELADPIAVTAAPDGTIFVVNKGRPRGSVERLRVDFASGRATVRERTEIGDLGTTNLGRAAAFTDAGGRPTVVVARAAEGAGSADDGLYNVDP